MLEMKMLPYSLSRRRQGQDNTILSCLVRVGDVNTIGDKTRQFCLISTQFTICNCSISNILKITENLEIGNWVETRQNCFVLSPIVFTPPTRTRQDSFVCSCVHTAETDKTKSHVLSCPYRRCEQAITWS